MKTESVAAIIIAVLGIVLFTALLVKGAIGQTTFAILIVALSFVCLALHGFSRIRELDLKNLKITLDKIEKVKAEIDEVYSGIQHLKRDPFVLDEKKMSELGLKPGAFPTASAAMRYPAGCIKRERERLARIFVKERSPQKIAEAILDPSLDELVFKWNGPEISLDIPTKSVEKRKKAQENKMGESSG